MRMGRSVKNEYRYYIWLHFRLGHCLSTLTERNFHSAWGVGHEDLTLHGAPGLVVAEGECRRSLYLCGIEIEVEGRIQME